MLSKFAQFKKKNLNLQPITLILFDGKFAADQLFQANLVWLSKTLISSPFNLSQINPHSA